MVVKILSATTPELRDGVFRIRHKVFVEEESLLKPTADGRLFDRFDAYPTANILAVTSGDEVVGSMRLSIDSTVGLQADQHFDFRKHLADNSRIIHAGMLCMLSSHRSSGLSIGLISTAADFVLSEGVSHMVAPINPNAATLMQRIGFEAVGENFVDPHTGAEMVPLILGAEQVNGAYVDFVAQYECGPLFGEYERWFCAADEPICTKATSGTGVFLVVDGLVSVQKSDRVAIKLGPGAIFGGRTQASPDIATGDVFADTDAQLIVWPTDGNASGRSEALFRTPHVANVFVERTQAMIARLKRDGP